MKSNRIKTLLKEVNRYADFTDWALKNHLLYKPIENGMLIGLYFNSSGFSPDKFEVVAFVQPLFVPSSHIDLSFGINVKTPENHQWWVYDESQLESIAFSLASNLAKAEKVFISNFSDSKSFYKFYQKHKSQSFRFFEAVAYSAAYAQLSNSETELNDLLSFLRKKEDISNKWVKEVYDNTQRLISSSNPSEILNEWERVSRSVLRL